MKILAFPASNDGAETVTRPGGAMKRFETLVFLAALVALAGCTNSTTTSPLPNQSEPPMTGKISHIVIMVQENRSFDNIFAGFPGANTTLEGPCKPAPWCKGSHKIRLHSVTLQAGLGPNEGTDIDHSHNGGARGPAPEGGFELECDANAAHVCQMDGFDLIRFGEEGGGEVAKTYPYAYIDRTESKPYWNLAKQYTLADDMFFNETASSFIAHQILLSGTVQINSHEWVTDQPPNPPWGCDSTPGDNAPILYANGKEFSYPGIFPCFKWSTIADLLDAKEVPWNYYVDVLPNPYGDFSGGVWNGFRAISKIFHGPDWKKNISSPNTNIFSDLSSGKLANVSWVIPTLYDSDHPASGCNGGPWWVTKVVNAIGTSQYWDSTAIVLVWDDWGGWYDNVPPKYTNPSTLGFRVPMIVISPWAKPGYIAHTQYDDGSILKFIEQTFDLGSLGTIDKTANSMEDVFDFTQTPNKFTAAPEPKAMSCKDQTTNPKDVEEVIDHDGGVPE
jgi:phospholipase C